MNYRLSLSVCVDELFDDLLYFVLVLSIGKVILRCINSQNLTVLLPLYPSFMFLMKLLEEI